jgi:hypothetical protein
MKLEIILISLLLLAPNLGVEKKKGPVKSPLQKILTVSDSEVIEKLDLLMNFEIVKDLDQYDNLSNMLKDDEKN